MRVLVKSKKTFNAVELSNVSNIAYSGGNYVITYGSPSTTSTYSAADYIISILF